jgi:hypothetical protein
VQAYTVRIIVSEVVKGQSVLIGLQKVRKKVEVQPVVKVEGVMGEGMAVEVR